MTRIIKYTIAMALGFVTLSSCDGFLDKEPSSSVTTDEAITDYASTLTALYGAYDALQGNSSYTTYYGARMVYFADVQGDLIQSRTAGMRSSSCYEMQYFADNAPVIWAQPYRVIGRANNVIEAIEEGKASDGTEAEINNAKGQAMFLRAIAHFDLCRVYSLPYTVDAQSMGIPIITAPMSAADIVEINSERGTVEDVYTFVIEQLTEAATLIDDNTQTYGFANSWTCKALLSRVYLYKGDNTNALSVAEDIINNSPYTLWANSNYKTEWSAEGGSSESIFEIVNFDTSDWVDKESIGYLYAAAGYADMIATPKLVDYFTANPDDVRGTVLVSSNLAVFDGMEYEGLNVFVLKYPGRASTGYEPGVSNIPVLRLSEIYLNAAEAAQKLGQSTLADTYVNAIAGRNPGVSYTGATLEEILWERGIELYAEGHRKFDLLRNNMTITRQNPSWGYIFTENASISYDNDYYRALLPIPISELNANPSLRNQQNPGYGSN